MKCPYLPLPTKRPVPSLGGARVRYRPIIPIQISGPSNSRIYDGCLDSASDDTIFPLALAHKLGVDLTGAPQGEAHPVGGLIIPYSYATVTLRLSDGLDTCEWQAVVGFVDLPLRWALFGHAGFLNFFDAELHSGPREVVLTPGSLFAGRRMTSRPSSP